MFLKRISVSMFAVFCFFLLCSSRAMSGESLIKVGEKAPDFTLVAQDGSSVSLKDFANKKSVVLYFYPKDNTPICTKEACSFKDQYEVFTKDGAEVLGVSSDSTASHKEFAAAHALPFKLLSDTDGALRKAYGVPSTLGIKPGRVTFVIDKSGVVQMVFNAQLEAKKHVDEALKVLQADKAKSNG